MKIEKFYELVDRYQAGKATPDEQALVETYYHYLTQGRTEREPEEEERMHTVVLERIMKHTVEHAAPVHRVHFIRRYRWAAAAVFLFAVAGTYFLVQPKKQELLSQVKRFKNDVQPGRTGAILTIEGGQTILLDTASNGNVLGHFTKGDSTLSVQSTTVQYAMLSTPAAHTEVLQLKDGSTVWLNAASSIRFPTVFTGKTREVEVTGEVYIKVAHNAAMPFKVRVNGQEIEDIGTEFNINAYDNEKVIKTTLVEGSVRVTHNTKSIVLKPGEQSQAAQSGNLKLVSNPDMEETLAWKNGVFRYDGTGIEDIMKQVQRWYGVEVVFQDNVEEEFVARIPRNVPVSELLNLLEGTNHVHFIIEGKKITVMK